ncbi:sulfotransferase family protein [Cerasicoccus frondis]|uniref:sulfotransferase family protein n=1 Tax=Cerasicoccus frondis TaxID=490090 RepID=UPI0028529F32|nr:sulfotransferase family 2 domain-containing protein [Cerasicoccus frondis]
MGNIRSIAIKAAGKCMSKSMRNQLRLAICPNTLWPYQTWLINPKHHFIYCPIPKVACTSLKHWFIHSLGEDIDFKDISEAHAHVDKNYTLLHTDRRQAKHAIHHYQRMVVVRNPWSRIVSGYIDKFVREPFNPPKADVMEAIYRRKGHQVNRTGTYIWKTMGQEIKMPMDPAIPYHEGISFQDFVEYLSLTPNRELDAHWLPQHSFLGKYQFQWVLKVEDLNHDVTQFENAINMPNIELARLHNADSKPAKQSLPPDSKLSALVSSELVDYSSKLKPHNLLTKELVEQLGERFAQDAKQFHYQPPKLSDK